MTDYPFVSKLNVIGELEKISFQPGMFFGSEKRIFAKALLLLLREQA